FFFTVPRSEWRKRGQHLAWVAFLVIVIAGWWYWRNYHLYGDPTAATETEKLLRTRRLDAMSLREAWGLLTLASGKLWLEASSVYMTIRWLEVVSWILNGLFVIGLVALWRNKNVS